tara:strand:- start:7178 stop:8242 length:1065 start_codon:yes stop_codon:yes gene_type:complete
MENKYKKFIATDKISINLALKKIKKGGKKGLIITEKNNLVKGTLTDSDIRNAIIEGAKLDSSIQKIYQKKPYCIDEAEIKETNLKRIFLKKGYPFIPIVDKKKQLVRILFWEDIFSKEKDLILRKLKADVVIMAGGKGNRLKPMSDIFPKPLIPLNGKPLISHVINNFEKYKVSHFYLSVNYKSSLIKTYFKDIKAKYKLDFIDEIKPLGTIGALTKLKSKLKKHFILTNCDIIVDIDYVDLEKFHFKKKNDITLVVTSKEFSLPYGNCIIGEEGNLLRIEEKPTYNFFVNSGIYMINRDMISLIPENKKYDIDQFLNQALKKNYNIGIYPIQSDKWLDVGSWSDFYKASKLGN